MASNTETLLPDNGKLVENITYFARALRKAGLRIGSGRVADAIMAVNAAGFSNKQDFYWTLHACFVSRPEHRVVFAQIFRLYWRDSRFLEEMMAMLLPAINLAREQSAPEAAEKRAAEALLDGAKHRQTPSEKQDGSEIELDGSLTYSSQESLQHLDFEQMSIAEMAIAKKMIAQLRLPVRPMVSRRTRAAHRGDLADWRATMRIAARQGGEIRQIAKKQRRERWPNLVALCDISGSMAAYSRAVLHFLHTASNAKEAGWAKVHSFTFGTQLTNISHHFKHRDVDAALAKAGAQAQDWEGGTRIGACLRSFNRDWSRRVMGSGSVVLLITDGLDRDDPDLLGREMERLQLSSRKLIWVNPLLRWDGFAPKARGIREMLPFVDSFRAGHNIASLAALAQALSKPDDIGEKARLMQLLRENK